MEILQEIKRLSHIDKLRVMEALWKDLSGDEESMIRLHGMKIPLKKLKIE